MPNVVTHPGADHSEMQGEMAASTGLYETMRRKYEYYFQVTHDQLGMASDAETSQLRSWIDSIAPTDTAKIKNANKWYQQDYQKRARSALELYHGDFLPPLQRALSAGVISQGSFEQWMEWVQSGSRDYKEKEQSIERVLPKYLAERQDLHSKRQAILRDKRIGVMGSSSDPKLKGLATKITDDDYFFNTLSLKQRQNLTDELLNALPLADGEERLFAGFKESLDQAMGKGLISKESHKKWIARFKKPADQLKTKEYFVTHQFPSYVKGWQTEHDKRKKLKENPLFKMLSEKDIKELSKFKDDTKFRNLHFDSKQNLNNLVKNALKTKSDSEKRWFREVTNAIDSAADARYVSRDRVGELVQHMEEHGRTITEVKNFIKEWAKLRYRFDTIERKMLTGKVPQGLNHLSEEKFLMMPYKQRLIYVADVESRLNMETSEVRDTPFQDAKGKVRHALDVEDWEEAQYYLNKAWPLAQSDDEIRELRALETFLRSFGKDVPSKNEDAMEEINAAKKEIDEVLALLPTPLRPFYEKALIRGGECTRCVSTLVYNVKWCQDRGYLPSNPSINKDAAREETQWRLSASGPGHGDGLEHNRIEGLDGSAIKKEGWRPNNIYTSSSQADTIAAASDAHKNDFSYWYWGNLIVDGVSQGEYAYVSTQLNYRIKRASRTLDRHGLRYHSVGPLSSMN